MRGELNQAMTEKSWAHLQNMNVAELRKQYEHLFGEQSKSANKQYLFRRIAWRLQAEASGGLSERACKRIEDIADDRDLRTRLPADFSARQTWASEHSGRDWRIPCPGSLLTRKYDQRQIVVKVLEHGFEYDSRQYSSLSAIAREVTGTRWNGLLFFGLTGRS